MNTLTLDTPVGEFVTVRPRTARVFERLGFDFCCGGKRPLKEVCAEKGLNSEAVLSDLLTESPDAPEQRTDTDWTRSSLTALTDNIVVTHHAWLRREIPRLTALAHKVALRHGSAHPELQQVLEVFLGFVSEMHAHMFKEETILFPAIGRLEAGAAHTHFPCGSIEAPIAEMEHEHDQAGDALKTLRYLTAGFTPPTDACRSYVALLEGLAALEADMHVHVHKENSILFPRALKLQKLGSGSVVCS